MKYSRLPRPVTCLFVLLFTGTYCRAHGFGEQLELEIPLWLWLGGAGLTVLLSFAVVIDFLPKRLQSLEYPQIDISNYRLVKLATSQFTLWFARLLVLFLLGLVVSAGIFGSQTPQQNIAPTTIWIVFWVGVSFTSVLLGDYWRVINPLTTIYYLVFRTSVVDDFDDPRLTVWPVASLFGAFMFAEHLWPSADVPRSLAFLTLAYLVFSIGAMRKFGPSNWLSNAEIFSMAFGVFAKFSPLRFSLTDENSVKIYLRPPAIALLERRPSNANLSTLIIMLLAGVTFDGWIETALWKNFLFKQSLVVSDLFSLDGAMLLINFLVMMSFPLIFFGLFLLACVATKNILANQSMTSWHLLRHYATSLIPIAIAYHFAHYAMLLLIDGQGFFILLSDPFGFGWNIFGSANEAINTKLFSASSIWYYVVFMIVTGHMLSVYLAHLVTLAISESKAVAVKAGTPILLLMVFYTVISLWVIAQPALQA